MHNLHAQLAYSFDDGSKSMVKSFTHGNVSSFKVLCTIYKS